MGTFQGLSLKIHLVKIITLLIKHENVRTSLKQDKDWL